MPARAAPGRASALPPPAAPSEPAAASAATSSPAPAAAARRNSRGQAHPAARRPSPRATRPAAPPGASQPPGFDDLAAIDREERGEPRQHAELLRHRDDLVLELAALARGVPILEIADLRARPARVQPARRVARRRAPSSRAIRIRSGSPKRRALELDRRARRRCAAVAAEDRHRRARVDVGQLAPARSSSRSSVEPARRSAQLGRDRRADPAVDLRHHRVEPILRLDELAQPAARAREPAQERRVDRLIDAEREHRARCAGSARARAGCDPRCRPARR